MICGVLLVGGLAFGGTSGSAQGTGSWLPLLFVLPCAIMMFMCMKGMGDKRGDAGSDPKPGAKD